MIGVSRLLCGTITPGDALRYGRDSARMPAHLLHYSADKKPVVVWNCTRRCNLKCVHCYASSRDEHYPGELSTEEGKWLLDSLAAFGVPTVLLSGGEPLMRPDLLELAAHARERGLRCVLSTNGTRISPETAADLKAAGMQYVGISVDGIGAVHDRVRGQRGAFEEALAGIRNCVAAGLRVGLRFTVHRLNRDQLPAVLDLLEQENIPRCCIYHLAYSGRGEKMQRHDLTPEETRQVVDEIFDRVAEMRRRGVDKDVLTVDNHADGAYLYLRVLREQPERAAEVYDLLRWNGGNQSGVAVACVDNVGNVHPDQFSWHITFGNVRERTFGEIWTDRGHPVMDLLKERAGRLQGRCASCRFLEICNGNLRVRAEQYHGDMLAPDPACYLTDEEIAST